MRMILVLLLAFSTGVACSARHGAVDGQRILFVGNSLTYVGNLPAVYSALASANGHPTRSDMIVSGGATLSQRVADGSVREALSGGGYSMLVLQERGGDLACFFGQDSCMESRKALDELAGLARENGVEAVLLGTYQASPAASRNIVEAESAAAAEAGIHYAEVSETLQRLRESEPDLAWFADDGMHPGTDLALLNAIALHRVLHAALPAALPLEVSAPIYGTTSGLDSRPRRADDPPPLPATPSGTSYPASTLEAILRIAPIR